MSTTGTPIDDSSLSPPLNLIFSLFCFPAEAMYVYGCPHTSSNSFAGWRIQTFGSTNQPGRSESKSQLSRTFTCDRLYTWPICPLQRPPPSVARQTRCQRPDTDSTPGSPRFQRPCDKDTSKTSATNWQLSHRTPRLKPTKKNALRASFSCET